MTMRIILVVLLFIAALPAWAQVPPPPPPPPPPPLPGISGQLWDAKTGLPLQGGIYPYPSVTIYTIDPVYGYRSTVAYTDCYRGQGCPDANGQWNFIWDYNGVPIPAGWYDIDAGATRYELHRVPRFYYDGVSYQVKPIGLDPWKVDPRLKSLSGVPSKGGTLKWEYEVVNLENAPLFLKVHSVYGGPGLTTYYGERQVGLPKPVLLLPGGTANVKGKLDIPSDIPDGSFLCVLLKVDDGRSQLTERAQIGYCVIKGQATKPAIYREEDVRHLIRR